MKIRLSALAAALSMLLPMSSVQAQTFEDIRAAAKGQTVYFNAWGGSDAINQYIEWAAQTVEARDGVNVELVKIDDAAQVVARLLAEKSANNNAQGSVDLIWVNGENFRTLKTHDLLVDAWTAQLPSYQYVDTQGKPSTTLDFGEPVNHLEAPWGMAQLVFSYDTQTLESPPEDMQALLAYAKANPGRVTYPNPPNFHGTTFVKQVLLELVDERSVLSKPVTEADFAAVTAPVWAFLDALHPHMWRDGANYPRDASVMRQLLNDGEIDIAFSFNPNDASRAIANGELPETVRTYVHKHGSLGNTHFVAIPWNAQAKEGAMVFADFLMSAQAQAHKANPDVWGDPTVLDVENLPAEDKALFDALSLGVATLSADQLGDVLTEPHASWVTALEAEWAKRYVQ